MGCGGSVEEQCVLSVVVCWGVYGECSGVGFVGLRECNATRHLVRLPSDKALVVTPRTTAPYTIPRIATNQIAVFASRDWRTHLRYPAHPHA